MKILVDHTLPFALAHGGYQTQIEMTKLALEHAGLEVESLRWWDDRQRGDVIHLFAPASIDYLNLARQKGVPVVLNSLLGGDLCLSEARLRRKGWKVALLPKIPGFGGISGLLPWQSFHLCTLNVVSLAAEKRILENVYRVPPERATVLPYGMSEAYLRAEPSLRTGDHLICTGTITPRKRQVETARLALRAEAPVLFVGKPYTLSDPYWREFESLIDDRFVRYLSHVSDEAQMIELYRAARGFVLASDSENWCLSAHEAAACGLPCLLRSQPWSRERFGPKAHYLTENPVRDVEVLRAFYRDATTLPAPKVRQWSWWEIGEQLAAIYRRLPEMADK